MIKNKQSDLILSICIPTYNQPERVKKLLDNISEQAMPGIELLIRDDSSNSETKEIIEKIKDNFPISIKYFKGEKASRGGYDLALLFLTQKARGRYIWWLGDDILSNGAIDYLIQTVKKTPEISFIWLNSQNINNDNDIALQLGGNKFFTNSDEIIETNIGLLGFPSATIIKRSHTLSGVDGAKEFIGTTLTGFYLVLYVLSQSGRFYFVQKPFILCKPKPQGESRWYDSFQVHGINYFLIAQAFKDKFSSKSLRKALSDKFGMAWRAVVVERALGFTTGFGAKTPKIKQMFKCYWSYPEFYIALPLFLTPRPILKYLYKIYKIMKSVY